MMICTTGTTLDELQSAYDAMIEAASAMDRCSDECVAAMHDAAMLLREIRYLEAA